MLGALETEKSLLIEQPFGIAVLVKVWLGLQSSRSSIEADGLCLGSQEQPRWNCGGQAGKNTERQSNAGEVRHAVGLSPLTSSLT